MPQRNPVSSTATSFRSFGFCDTKCVSLIPFHVSQPHAAARLGSSFLTERQERAGGEGGRERGAFSENLPLDKKRVPETFELFLRVRFLIKCRSEFCAKPMKRFQTKQKGCLTHLKVINQSRRVYGGKKKNRKKQKGNKKKQQRKPKTDARASKRAFYVELTNIEQI